ncbi:MAG TPA: hypothetical protein VFJ82_13345 [Longimicrobium sp.]|nr:hypothetical protein [Longimicrobium sp.]
MGDAEESRLTQLTARFPSLAQSHFRFTSPDDGGYNCLAWAAGETQRCWHPSAFGGLFWPGGPADDTVAEWVRAFEELGYEPCESDALETGFEKVAIYAERDFPLHVARQLSNGYWTSKLGVREDVEHELPALTGREYGRVVAVLRRAHPGSPSPSMG